MTDGESEGGDCDEVYAKDEVNQEESEQDDAADTKLHNAIFINWQIE